MDAPSWQYAVSVWMPFITGHLSVFGSGWIIWHVFCQAGNASGSTARQYRNHSAVLIRHQQQEQQHGNSLPSVTYLAHVRQKLQQKPHLRILLALSLYDLLGSGAFAWTFAFSPQGKSGYDGAFGNMASCRTQGFLIQASSAVAIYSGLLSLYYYLTICQGIRLETWWAWEKVVHIVTFCIVMGLAIAGVATDMFHPIYAYCYITPYPSMCDNNDMKNTCKTWFTPDDMGWILQVWGHWMMQIAIVVVFFSNYMIWQKVRMQSRRMKRYHVKKTTTMTTTTSNKNNNIIHNNSYHNNSTSSIPDASMHSTDSARNSVLARMSLSSRRFLRSRDNNNNAEASKRSKRETLVFQQCFFLTLAFILCAMGPTTFHLTMWTRGYMAFWQTFLIVVLGPLHGFMNFVVFSRPIYLGVRKKYAGKLTSWQVLRAVYFRRDPNATAAQWAEQRSTTNSSSANHLNDGNNNNKTMSAESSGNMISTMHQHTSMNLTSRMESTAPEIVETTAVVPADEPNKTSHDPYDDKNENQEYLENEDDDISDAMSLGDLNQYDDEDITATQVPIETSHNGAASPPTVEEVAREKQEEVQDNKASTPSEISRPSDSKPLETVYSEELPLEEEEEDIQQDKQHQEDKLQERFDGEPF